MYDESCLPRIGSNIKILRSTCLFKQQQFAERIGISQTHLSNIEHNNVQVSLKLLLRSANVLGCTLETLLDRKAAAEWAEARYTEKPGQTGAQKKPTKKSTAKSRSTKLCGS